MTYEELDALLSDQTIRDFEALIERTCVRATTLGSDDMLRALATLLVSNLATVLTRRASKAGAAEHAADCCHLLFSIIEGIYEAGGKTVPAPLKPSNGLTPTPANTRRKAI